MYFKNKYFVKLYLNIFTVTLDQFSSFKEQKQFIFKSSRVHYELCNVFPAQLRGEERGRR